MPLVNLLVFLFKSLVLIINTYKTYSNIYFNASNNFDFNFILKPVYPEIYHSL